MAPVCVCTLFSWGSRSLRDEGRELLDLAGPSLDFKLGLLDPVVGPLRILREDLLLLAARAPNRVR